MDEAEEVVQDAEIVDGLPVVTESGVLEERSVGALAPAQVAALAATGFVAGACTVAVVKRHRTKKAAKKRKKSGPLGEIVGSNSFLIDVHLLKRS